MMGSEMESVESAGKIFIAAREAMNMTSVEVADHLRLLPRVIDAIEKESFESLPVSAFARGYIVAYARLLKIPPDGMLASYERYSKQKDAEEKAKINVNTRKASSFQDVLTWGNQNPFYLASAALLLCFVTIVISVLIFGGNDNSAEDTNPDSLNTSETLIAREDKQQIETKNNQSLVSKKYLQ